MSGGYFDIIKAIFMVLTKMEKSSSFYIISFVQSIQQKIPPLIPESIFR
jgi:hypothetical protein